MYETDMHNYILVGHEPVMEPDLMKWAEWMETAYRHVAVQQLNVEVLISTVFLGINHQWGIGSPLLFETMVFGGIHDQDCYRYSTWDEALAGHKRLVAEILAEYEK